MKRFCLIALALSVFSHASVEAASRPAAKGRTAAPQTVKEQPEPAAVNILSIIPAQGEPGAAITISGTGFGTEPAVYLGMERVPLRLTESSVITFDIPPLSAGLYALYVRRPDGTISKVYNFPVLPRKPTISSISPDRVSSCSSNREISVRGAYFRPDSRISFDGALVPSTFQGNGLITFPLPQVQGGIHNVQVRNLGDDTLSASVALTIETRPEILSVRRGTDLVNAYELVIEGRNFLQGSTLVVDGKRISSGGGYVEQERVYYGGCDSMTYLRFPYDTTPRNIRIQVINPTGEESSIYQMSTP